MADEILTTDLGTPNVPGTQPILPAAPSEGAHIIEEIVTKPAPPHTSEELKKESETIEGILKEIKLPERMSAPESQRSKGRRVFDTMLGVLSSNLTNTAGKFTPVADKVSEDALMTTGVDVTSNKLPGAALGENLKSSIVSPLRTLKDDLQTIVREKKMSLVRIVALEGDKRQGENDAEHAEVKRVHVHRILRILFAVLILLILGASALLGVYIIMQERSGTPMQRSDTSILFAENTFTLPLDDHKSFEMRRIVARARADNGGVMGSITRLVPMIPQTNTDGTNSEKTLALDEFFRALGTRASQDLLRALSSEFFFGIHTVDENAPLFVIPVLSYERAFSGMLAWEQTMNADMAPIFTRVPDQVQGVGGLPEKRRFGDAVIRNYDVRVLKNDAGVIELYYSFPTRHLLVIGESVYSFTEILSRLRAGRKL